MTQLSAASTEWPPSTMKVRGRLRVVWLALWLVGAAGSVVLGIYEDTPESPHEWWWLPLFLLLAAVGVVLAVRSFGLGVDADGNGVIVRNTLRARPIPWRDLAAIEFEGVDSEAIPNMYYKLVFHRQDGSRVTAEAPGGAIEPGEYLFELRERLLAMRSAALGYPTQPADLPSDTGGSDEEAAPVAEPSSWPAPPRSGSTETEDDLPAVSARSRVKGWVALIAGVAVTLAITFAPVPSLGLLLWHAGRIFNVDVMPQQIYWEDLQPGMCVSEDPNEVDYQVVDCNAEHEEEVMFRGTIAGIAEWPGDSAVDAAALEKCTPAFDSYVGKKFDDSRLDFSFVTPDEEGWNDGKVTLICLVLDPTTTWSPAHCGAPTSRDTDLPSDPHVGVLNCRLMSMVSGGLRPTCGLQVRLLAPLTPDGLDGQTPHDGGVPLRPPSSPHSQPVRTVGARLGRAGSGVSELASHRRPPCSTALSRPSGSILRRTGALCAG